MRDKKLKILLKVGLELIRLYCFFRRKRNQERIIAAVLLFPAFLLLIPTYTFTLTLLQSFLFQAMLLYGLLAIFWIRRYHCRLAGVNFIIYLLLLIKINGPIEKGYQVIQGEAQLKVLQLNLRTGNLAHDETIESVLALEPDFVSFQEVGRKWATVLKQELPGHFPYYKIVQHPDEGQGIAVFSKFPLVGTEALLWGGTANLVGRVKVGEEEINFLSLHTRSPRSRIRWNERNDHITEAKKYIAQQEGEFVVLGDFNTVPWDSRLMNFKSSTQLKDSRRKLTPTYPTWTPFIAQIPIDYIFHSKGIGCKSLDSVRITSDHKGVLGTFSIKGWVHN